MIRASGLALEGLVLQDLRHSVRMLSKSPGLTAAAILSLGLGIGANTTIYSVIHGVMMRASAFREPERLVAIWESNPSRGVRHSDAAVTSALEWHRQNHVFEGIEMSTFGSARAITGRCSSAIITGSGGSMRNRRL
jgi:putative ABC transport system permease protein